MRSDAGPRVRRTPRLAVIVMATLALTLWAMLATAREIDPGTDLCSVVNSLPEGEELVLLPGDYQGPCAIRRGGSAGHPLVVRGADPTHRPRIVYGGVAANVIEVRASHVTLRGLEFGPTQQDVDAVRVFNGDGVTVEECHFTQVGGIAVVANHSSIRGLVVRRNVIRDSTATAMYFGCHDGDGCVVSGLVVEGNFIQGVTAPEPQIGYGIQFKLNSFGQIRSNVVMNTKGPGIMVYGTRHGTNLNVVERNVTIGSRNASGIVVGGGTAIVRNNIAASNEGAGIELLDYKNRGLLRTILVANNTVYGNRAGGITAPETGLSAVSIVNNATEAHGGTHPYPMPRRGLRVAGNVDCTDVLCFADAGHYNFSPGLGSLLTGAGISLKEVGMPREDFFGVPRGKPLGVGAIDRPSEPLTL